MANNTAVTHDSFSSPVQPVMLSRKRSNSDEATAGLQQKSLSFTQHNNNNPIRSDFSRQEIEDVLLDPFTDVKTSRKKKFGFLWTIKRHKTTKIRDELLDCFIWRSQPLLPSGKFVRYWTFVLALSVVYAIIIVPLDLAFQIPLLPWIVFTLMMNFVFVIDVFLNFNISYRHSEGYFESSFKKIAWRYVRTFFILDVVASFPYDLVGLILLLQGANTDSVALQVLKLLKLLRILRITVLIRIIMEFGVSVRSLLIILLVTFILSAHWFACLFWKVASAEGYQNSWVNRQNSIVGLANQTVAVQYSTSFYWAIVTQATLGYGDITPVTYPEQIYTIVVILLGATLYAVIVASIGQIVSSIFNHETEYNRWMDKVRTFSKSYNLPRNVKMRLEKYYEYIWDKRRTFKKEAFTDSLPFGLRADVVDAINEKVLYSNIVFQKCSFEFRHMLALRLGVGMVRLPDDVLFFEGDDVEKLVIVRQGLLELVLNCNGMNELIVASRRNGQYCGDIGMFDEVATAGSTAGEDSLMVAAYKPVHFLTCVVSDYSHVYVVSKDDLFTVLGNFKDERQLFIVVAKARRRAAEQLLREFKNAHARGSSSSMKNTTSSRAYDIQNIIRPKSLAFERTKQLWSKWEDAVSPDADERMSTNVIESHVAMNRPTFLDVGGAAAGESQRGISFGSATSQGQAQPLQFPFPMGLHHSESDISLAATAAAAASAAMQKLSNVVVATAGGVTGSTSGVVMGGAAPAGVAVKKPRRRREFPLPETVGSGAVAAPQVSSAAMPDNSFEINALLVRLAKKVEDLETRSLTANRPMTIDTSRR